MGRLGAVLLPLVTWYLFTLLDLVVGLNEDNADPATDDTALFWYRAITLIWPPLQFGLIFGLIYYATRAEHLAIWEKLTLFFGVGVVSGVVGIHVCARAGTSAEPP